MDFYDKSVLLIGSGKDLNERNLGERIEAGEWDYVARINKRYGNVTDVGNRTDICFVAKEVFLHQFMRGLLNKENEAPLVVSFLEGINCTANYREFTASALNLGKVCSSGLCAVKWLIDKGARVDIIGFNAPKGLAEDANKKIYCYGVVDKNPNFDWALELNWIKSQPNVVFL